MTAQVADTWAVAVVLGLTLAGGLALVLGRVPRWGAPSLSRRLAPYLADVVGPVPVFGRGAGPLDLVSVVSGGVRRVVTSFGGGDAVAERLRRAGRAPDAAAFRARQLLWAVVGFVAGSLASIALVLMAVATPAAWVLPLVGAASAALTVDVLLSRAAAARAERIHEELPTILQFLALCLSAGEGILDALRRVSAAGAGDLGDELRTLVLDVGTGAPLPGALTRLAGDLDVPGLSRAIDQIVAGIESGAPLAGVLQAQAADAREEAKRALIERAGRKEIWMLIPLVFLILPLSVLFAVYPGIFMLRLGLS